MKSPMCSRQLAHQDMELELGKRAALATSEEPIGIGKSSTPCSLPLPGRLQIPWLGGVSLIPIIGVVKMLPAPEDLGITVAFDLISLNSWPVSQILRMI